MFTFGLTLIWGASIGAVRAWPFYDDGGLRNLLLDCTLTCHFDIHPGETSNHQAYNRLQRHPWVARVWYDDTYTLSWELNGSQIGALHPTAFGRIYIDQRTDTVWQFIVPLSRPYGDVLATLSEPDKINLVSLSCRTFYEAVYGDLVARSVIDCPLTDQQLWNADTSLAYAAFPQ